VATTEPGRYKGAEGFVTGTGAFDAYWEYMLETAIQATAINPGLGGGALVTYDGLIRGVVSLNLGLVGSCSLSIPIDLFHARRDELLGRERFTGRPERPWLGFFPQPLERGVYVAGVVPGAPAAKSGMQEGDVILSINGEEISSRRHLYETLWKGKAGDAIELTLYREKAFKTIGVVSESRAEFFR
jgi:serine protease Do